MDMGSEPLRRIVVYHGGDMMTLQYGREPDEWTQCYINELQAFLDGKPLCTGEDGLKVVEILEAIT
jgi:hypothetical protein